MRQKIGVKRDVSGRTVMAYLGLTDRDGIGRGGRRPEEVIDVAGGELYLLSRPRIRLTFERVSARKAALPGHDQQATPTTAPTFTEYLHVIVRNRFGPVFIRAISEVHP